MSSQTKIKLYRPHIKQIPVHTACNDDTTFFVTIVAGRQSGKTALSQQQALFWSLDKPNIETYWVSPTAAQAAKVYKQLLKMIVNTPFIKSHKGSQGDTEIIFQNGSIIKFRSSAQEDSLRGETIDYLIIDEAAFVKESVYQEILLPMLNVRGKKVLIISTPKGKNWFHKMYVNGINGVSAHKSFKFTSMDNPYSNPIIIQIAKENLPDALFRQEYLGEFIDATAIIENVHELAMLQLIKEPVEGDKYYIGIDVALRNDFNVVIVMNQKDEMVYYDRINNISSPELKERLVKIFDKWKPKKIYIEENNQGLPILQDLQKIHKVKNIEGFLTTSKSKPEIVNNLINAFASRKIFIVDDEIVKNELEMFTMTVSPTGHVKYAAPDGYNDDIVMALAIAWECLQKNRGKENIQVYKLSN